MKPIMISKALVFCTLFLFAQGASAVVFEVTTAEEFQAALTTAASNGGDDEIILPEAKLPGPFRFVNREQFNLRIIGQGRRKTVLSGGQQSFVLEINLNGFNDLEVEIARLSIVEGRSVSNGAGFNVTGIDWPYPEGQFVLPTISLTDVIFDNNEVSPGAAGSSVSISHATVTLNDVSISNSKYPSGFERYDKSSAIACSFCALSVSDSEFEDIETLIIDMHGSLFIQNTIFFGVWPVVIRYKRTGQGGGEDRAIRNYGTVKIQDSRVTRTATGGNFSGSSGKPVFDFYGVKNLEMIGNLVDDHSFLDNRDWLPILNFRGDFPISDDGVVKLERNRVASNQSVVCYGFGEENRSHLNFSRAYEIELVSNLLAFDSAVESSSRDDCFGPDLVSMHGFSQTSILNNTMVYGQSFEEQSGHFLNYASSESANTQLKVANNIFWRGGASDKPPFRISSRPTEALLRNNIVTKNAGYWDSEMNNIDTDPKFFDVNRGDFHLTEDSPGLNAGDNSFVVTDALDVAGADRVTEQKVDIGAYERSTTALHPGDANEDQSISQQEFDAYNAAWRTNETWPTAPSIIPVDFVTRAGYLLQKGGAYKNIGVGKPATWVPEDE